MKIQTKAQYREAIAALYSVGNASDTEHRRDWTKPQMVNASCVPLEDLVQRLIDLGVFTEEDRSIIFDDLLTN